MLNIRFKGIYEDEESIKRASKLRKNSTMFNEEATAQEFGKRSTLFVTPLILIMIIIGLVISKLNNIELKLTPKELIIGVLILIPLTVLVQLIHALTYPKEAKKDFYLIKKDLGIVLLSNSLVSKKRYILICIMPTILLSVIPYIIILIFMKYLPVMLVSYIYIDSIGINIITAGALLTAYRTIKQVPKDAQVFNHGYHSYWKKEKHAKHKI